MNVLKVEKIGCRRYRVKLNCGYPDWEIVEVKAMNEYIAIFKAIRGRLFMKLFYIR